MISKNILITVICTWYSRINFSWWLEGSTGSLQLPYWVCWLRRILTSKPFTASVSSHWKGYKNAIFACIYIFIVCLQPDQQFNCYFEQLSVSSFSRVFVQYWGGYGPLLIGIHVHVRLFQSISSAFIGAEPFACRHYYTSSSDDLLTLIIPRTCFKVQKRLLNCNAN